MYTGNSMRTAGIEPFLWPIAQIFSATEQLALSAGYIRKRSDTRYLFPVQAEWTDATLDSCLTFISEKLGIEAIATQTSHPTLELMVENCAPGIVRHPLRKDFFLAIIKSNDKSISLLTPGNAVKTISTPDFISVLYADLEQSGYASVDLLLNNIDIPEQRKRIARKALLRELLRESSIDGWWHLRLFPGENIFTQMKHAGIVRQFALFGLLYLISVGLIMASWLAIGQGALTGHIEIIWYICWAMLVFSQVPFTMVTNFITALISTGSATIFKQTLLYGALRLDPDTIRKQGTGQFLGRVMDSEAIEQMAQTGGFTALAAIIECILAAGVIISRSNGFYFSAVVISWFILTAFFMYRYYRQSGEWYNRYREMTNHMVENMIGHRTRLVQQNPAQWHGQENSNLAAYIAQSQQLDNTGVILNAVVQKGWLPFGLIVAAQIYLKNPGDLDEILITVGCILMIDRALAHLIQGSQTVIGILNMWRQVEPLCSSALHTENRDAAATNNYPLELRQDDQDGSPLLYVKNLVYRHAPERSPVVRNCSITIQTGDRLLLEGVSGSGKSTFAALLSGLRTPSSGELLFKGVPFSEVYLNSWRKKIVQVPRFHENHIFSETFGFNLLMGRQWPPDYADFEDAELICQELGLGDLLQKMPAGLQQQVGESGWRLSHGERSRVFIARALLQDADILILDESFAALDPENFLTVLECVMKHSKTLLVIAHP